MECMVCSVIFSQKMVLVTGMPEPPYRMAGQSKKMAEERYVYIFWVRLYSLEVWSYGWVTKRRFILQIIQRPEYIC
jgi:hypothetical protein